MRLAASKRFAATTVSLAETSSAAQLLRDAETAHEELRFDEAVALLERAWHRGESDPVQVRKIFALSGLAAGAMGDEDAARLWFSRWLSVEPDAALPAGSSPKLAALFADAQRGLGGASITARARVRDESLEVVIERDPLSLVTRLRAGDAVVTVQQGVAVELPAADAVDLLDRDGNVLATITPSRVIEPPRAEPPGWYARWPLWAGATGGFAVIGGVAFAIAASTRSEWRELNATSTQHEASEAIALEDRFDRAQWISRIAFGGAVVTGVVSAILFARRDEHRMTVTPTSGGAAVAWTIGF